MAELEASTERRLTILGWSAFGVALLVRVVAIVRANEAWVYARVPDDAFYFLEIARHLGRGDGPTFDGIHATNGFQPLWELLLVPLSWLGLDGLAGVKAAMLLAVACCAAAGIVFAAVLRRAVGPAAAAFAVAIAFHTSSVVNFFSNGMETGVTVLAFAGALLALVRFAEAPDTRRAVVLGVALGLLGLARVDLGALTIVAVIAGVGWQTRSLRLVGTVAGATVVVALPVLVWWQLAVGSIVPVSGRIKADIVHDGALEAHGGRLTSAHLDYLVDRATTYGREVLSGATSTLLPDGDGIVERSANRLLAFAFVGGLIGWCRTRTDDDPDRRRALLIVLAFAGLLVLKAVIDVVALPPWSLGYSAPQCALAGLLVGLGCWGLVRLADRRHLAVPAAAILLVLAVGGAFRGQWSSDTAEPVTGAWLATLAEAAAWLEEHEPPGRYGAFDAGILGYSLDDEHPVVNLDGLVNDPAHADRVIAADDRLALIGPSGIDVYINRGDPERLARAHPCWIELWRSDEDILTTSTPIGGVVTAEPIVVYDVSGDC